MWITKSSTSQEVQEEKPPLKMLLSELSEKQTNTEFEIKKDLDSKTINRLVIISLRFLFYTYIIYLLTYVYTQTFMDELNTKVLSLLNYLQRKSNLTLKESGTSPRTMKKNKSYATPTQNN